MKLFRKVFKKNNRQDRPNFINTHSANGPMNNGGQEIRIPVEHPRFCNELAPFTSIELIPNEKYLFFLDEEQFYSQAERFLQETTPVVNPSEIKDLNEILQDNFVIGELHQDIFPKIFLIHNMPRLKEAGFETFFLEHLYYDDQPLLDNFFETGIMPPKLKARLKEIDFMFGNFGGLGGHEGYGEWYDKMWKTYNYTNLVIAAQAAGIRVVAADLKMVYENQSKDPHEVSDYDEPDNESTCPKKLNVTSSTDTEATTRIDGGSLSTNSTTEDDPHADMPGTDVASPEEGNHEQKNSNHSVTQKSHTIKRFVGLNFTHAKILEHESPLKGKWFGLFGNGHINNLNKFLGIGNLHGVQVVYIFDGDTLVKIHKSAGENQILFNQTMLIKNFKLSGQAFLILYKDQPIPELTPIASIRFTKN